MAQEEDSFPRAGAPKGPEHHAAPPQRVDPRGPLFAVVVVGAFLFITVAYGPAPEGGELPWTLNPTGYLSPSGYLCLYLVSIPAKELANNLLSLLGRVVLQLDRMDVGDGKVRRLEALERIDLCYLALNTLVEFIGMNHVAAFMLRGPVEQQLRRISVLNGPVAFVLAMVLNDVIYYPFHLVAHRRGFYPLCHKQHHRQFVPFRGYADAANQHPFEQIYGFSIFIVSLHLTARVVGLHASTAWLAFLAWAVLNIANHLAFDSSFHLPVPYPAFPRDHQMHHRFPQCNYSTLTSLCDRIGGTFRPWRALGDPGPVQPPKLEWYEKLQDPAVPQEPQLLFQEAGRPEAFPSPWSVVGLLVGLLLGSLAVEVGRTGQLPTWHEYVIWVKPAVVMVNAALFCFAVDAATAEPAERKGKVERLYVKPRMTDNGLQEAMLPGHNQRFLGGKGVWKADLRKAVRPAAFKTD